MQEVQFNINPGQRPGEPKRFPISNAKGDARPGAEIDDRIVPESVTRTGRRFSDMADEQAPPPPDQVMMQMIAGFWVSRTVYAAATLGLADLVKEGPKSADELASATGTDGLSDAKLNATGRDFCQIWCD
jgi:hypothetical protein